MTHTSSYLRSYFAKFFAIPLVDIFNESFRSKTFPNIWKNLRVSAILKVTPCSTVDELRRISLTSVISKIQESYVVNWMNEDMEGKITDAQYGGVPGSSAVHDLINLVHKSGAKRWIARAKLSELFF